MLLTRSELFEILMQFGLTYGKESLDDSDVDDFISALEDRGDLDFSDDEWEEDEDDEQSY